MHISIWSAVVRPGKVLDGPRQSTPVISEEAQTAVTKSAEETTHVTVFVAVVNQGHCIELTLADRTGVILHPHEAKVLEDTQTVLLPSVNS